ncbi:MAG TPA: hypothetical protein VK956_18230, partial [Verrucomicrobium sp.]|nr:hypothetical protein [Verrucomicrobium sp.]
MSSVSFNDSLRVATLDPTLAFAINFDEHRLLVSQSVSAGFKGLLDSLGQTAVYSLAMQKLEDAMKSLEEARVKATQGTFTTTGTTASTSVMNAVNSGLSTQVEALRAAITAAQTSLTTALNNTTAGTPERTAATEAKAAADKAIVALDKIKSGDAINGFAEATQALADAQAAKTKADQALTNAQAAKTAAQATLTSAQGTLTTKQGDLTAAQAALTAAQNANPKVQATIDAAQTAVNNAQTAVNNAQTAVNNAQTALNAANARVTAATGVVTAAAASVTAIQKLVDFKDAPISQIKLTTTQQCYDLADGYSVTMWGNTGYATLTGPDGKGILIQPDGSTDPLDGSGEGWKFATTSTFVLPNEAKITITPASPPNAAVISATKGRNHLEITNIKANAAAAAALDDDGRHFDKTTVDGHKITMNGTATDSWTLSGSLLGDAGSREVVGTTASTAKFEVDAADVAIDPELKNFLIELGLNISDYDSDGDGKLNEEELFQVATIINTLVNTLQQSFQQVLDETAKASDALLELNRFLGQIQEQGDKPFEERAAQESENRDTLAAIQQRLESALSNLKALQGGGQGGASFSDAQTLLNQLTQAAQGETIQSTASVSLPQINSAPPSGAGSTPASGSGESIPDSPASQALRRAERLISGFLGGSRIDESQIPGTPDTVASLSKEDVAALAALVGLGLPISGSDAQALLSLIGKLQAELAGGGIATLNGEGLQLLETVKAALADVGLIPLSEENSLFLANLAAQLRGLNINIEETVELEGLLARLQGGPGPTENSTASVGLSTDTRKLTVADFQRLDAILSRLQDLPLGLSAADALRLETLARLVKSDLQNASTPAAGIGDQGGRVLTRADVQLFEELMFRLRGPDPDLAATLPSAVGGNPFAADPTLLKTISGNFATDPALLEKLKENVSKSVKVYNEQLGRARNLFVEAQAVV